MALAASPPAKSGETVTVACKLPNGIVLSVCTETMRTEAVMGGGSRDVREYVRGDRTHTVHGNAIAQGEPRKCEIIAGFALTRGVPGDLWAGWLAQHKDSALVRGGFIFAYASPGKAADAARERRDLRTGLEPIDPTKPMRVGLPRLPGNNADVSVEMSADPSVAAKIDHEFLETQIGA